MPQALSIGVDYQLFWTLTPRKLEPFIKAAKLRIDEKYKAINYSAWLSGMYVRSAIASAFNKNAKYPEQPFGEEKKVNPADKFRAWATAFNTQREKGGEAEDGS